MEDKVIIEIINGVEGQCVAINDYRVAGPKPWGGGKVSKKFTSDMSNMRRALKIGESAQTDKQPLKVAIAQVRAACCNCHSVSVDRFGRFDKVLRLLEQQATV